MIKIFNKFYKKQKGDNFSTIELLISISIILILGGIFLLNYNLKKETFDLNNSITTSAQEIRKAQNLIMAQTTRQCDDPYKGNSAQNYGVLFETEKNYTSLFVDKNVLLPDGTYIECKIEDKFFSPFIKISSITLKDKKGSTTSGLRSAWVSFDKDTLKVTISDGNSNDWQEMQVDFCIKSNCIPANTKKIIINNKGMIDI